MRVTHLFKTLLGPQLTGVADYIREPLHQGFGNRGSFNGQEHRRKIFRDIMKEISFSAIVETGSYRGTTTTFLAEISGLPVYTVEMDKRNFGYVRARFFWNKRVKVFQGDSRAFLRKLSASFESFQEPVFFYLDAHWDADLPLREEIELIFSHWNRAVIMVDDFQVPGDPGYTYDDYGADKSLCLDYLGSLSHLQMGAFFPSQKAELETGAKRGCVVLASDSILIKKLRMIQALVFYGVLQ